MSKRISLRDIDNLRMSSDDDTSTSSDDDVTGSRSNVKLQQSEDDKQEEAVEAPISSSSSSSGGGNAEMGHHHQVDSPSSPFKPTTDEDDSSAAFPSTVDCGEDGGKEDSLGQHEAATAQEDPVDAHEEEEKDVKPVLPPVMDISDVQKKKSDDDNQLPQQQKLSSSIVPSPRKTPIVSPRPPLNLLHKTPIKSSDSDSESDSVEEGGVCVEGNSGKDKEEVDQDEEESPDFNSDTIGSPTGRGAPPSRRNQDTDDQEDNNSLSNTNNTALANALRENKEGATNDDEDLANSYHCRDNGETTATVANADDNAEVAEPSPTPFHYKDETNPSDGSQSGTKTLEPLQVSETLDPLDTTQRGPTDSCQRDTSTGTAIHHQPAEEERDIHQRQQQQFQQPGESPTSLSSSSSSSSTDVLSQLEDGDEDSLAVSESSVNGRPTCAYVEDGAIGGGGKGVKEHENEPPLQTSTVVMMEDYYNPIKAKYGLTARDLMKRREQCAFKNIRYSSLPPTLEEKKESVAEFVRDMMLKHQETAAKQEAEDALRFQQREQEISARKAPMRFASDGSLLTVEQKLAISAKAKEDYEREWSTFKQQPSRLQIIEEQQQQFRDSTHGPMKYASGVAEEERKKNLELAQLAADELERRRKEKEENDKVEGFINSFQRSTTASRSAAEASFKELERKTSLMEKAGSLRTRPAADLLCASLNETSPSEAPARLHARFTATEKRRRQLLAEENQRKIDDEEARKKKLTKIPTKYNVSARLLKPTASLRFKEADLMIERRVNLEKSRCRASMASARASECGDINGSQAGGDDATASEAGDGSPRNHMSPSARVLSRNSFSRCGTDVMSICSPYGSMNKIGSPISHRLSFSRGMTNVSATTESNHPGDEQSPASTRTQCGGGSSPPLKNLPETALAKARRELNMRKREELEAKERVEMERRVSRPYTESHPSVSGLLSSGRR